MEFSIRSGWVGVEEALLLSEALLPNETGGRSHVRARKDFIRLLTAWSEDSVVGYLVTDFDRMYECLREFGVSPEHRHQGIGRALVNRFASTAVREEVCCDPLPHRRELLRRWGFDREDGGRLLGSPVAIAAATTPQE